MYMIIGADGKEYGPVTAEQLRKWVAEGRANAQTKARAEGGADWKPLPEFAEFSALFGGPSAAGVPPAASQVDAEKLSAEIIARDYRLDIGGCIGRSWELLKSDFWLVIGASFVAGLITSGCGIPYAGAVIALIVGGPMTGGLFALYLKKIRGQPATFGDAFLGFSTAFVPLMLAYIVSGLLTGLGLICCIVPGIYFGVCWSFAIPLVMDKKMDFWPAMELSRKVVGKHWWTVFGFAIVCGLLAIAGLAACCIGVFVTSALAQVAWMYAYEDIFGGSRAG